MFAIVQVAAAAALVAAACAVILFSMLAKLSGNFGVP